MMPLALVLVVSMDRISFNMNPSASSKKGSLFSRQSSRFSIAFRLSGEGIPNSFLDPLLLGGAR